MLKKKIKWRIGDIFLVPQIDKKYSLGQIIGCEAEVLNSVICAFYDIRFDSVPSKLIIDKLPQNKLISIQFTTKDLLDNGAWIIIGNVRPIICKLFQNNLKKLRRNEFVGTIIEGSGIIEEFLNAFYGLVPWDDWQDPYYLDKLLISSDKKQKNIKLTKHKNNTV